MAVDAIEARVERLSPTNLRVRYEALGRMADVVLPAAAARMRANNLWRTTCFELFLRGQHPTAYQEWNFSPSGQWAAYDFRAYREGMANAQTVGDPNIEAVIHADRLVLDVRLSLNLLEQPYWFGLSAVIEERRVGKSYWGHHSSSEPDFHHESCFRHELPPAGDR
jgi:hypothetical protein